MKETTLDSNHDMQNSCAKFAKNIHVHKNSSTNLANKHSMPPSSRSDPLFGYLNYWSPRKTSRINVSVQKLPAGQLLGDGFCVTKCLAFWTQEPSPRIRPEVTLAYFRGMCHKSMLVLMSVLCTEKLNKTTLYLFCLIWLRRAKGSRP